MIQAIKTAFLLRQWKKKKQFSERLAEFNRLFGHRCGFTLSKQAREGKDAPSLLYGEIDFLSFSLLLNKIGCTAEDHFFDLGSGLGKAVIAANLIYGCRSTGIECLPELINESNVLATMLPPSRQAAINFYLQDLHETNLENASIILCTTTAFFGAELQHVTQTLVKSPENCRVISLGKSLSSPQLAPLLETWMTVSWGVCRTYVYEKVTVCTDKIDE